MQMHHLHARNEAHSPICNEWLDIEAPYAIPTMEAKDVTIHVLGQNPYEDLKYLLLVLIWTSLYDPKCYEILKLVVTYPMSLENVA